MQMEAATSAAGRLPSNLSFGKNIRVIQYLWFQGTPCAHSSGPVRCNSALKCQVLLIIPHPYLTSVWGTMECIWIPFDIPLSAWICFSFAACPHLLAHSTGDSAHPQIWMEKAYRLQQSSCYSAAWMHILQFIYIVCGSHFLTWSHS